MTRSVRGRWFAIAFLLGGCASANRAAPPPSSSAAAPAAAQPPLDEAPFPLWPEVTHGKLANGMSYSILKHQKPEKRALLWLAVNAGSVQEDEPQRGLAHFDEHMAFDGTRHFAKTAIIDYIEKIGMRFGADLNAYTSFDQTVYQLEVPTDDPAFLGTGLDILRDWAGEVSYDPVELERERGVVLEEWRLGRGAAQRLFDQESKVLFQGSRYAERLPIGQAEVIKTAPRAELMRFYKDFYRPDLMSVIVVGDVDEKWIEQEIVKRFTTLQSPANERPRTLAGMPPADGMRVSIATDREASSLSVAIYNLLPHRPEASPRDLRRTLVEQLYSHMLNERLEELRHQPSAPFHAAFAGITSLVREIDAFARAAEAKDEQVEETLRTLFTEALRVERHGFTAGELARARASIQREYDENVARAATVNSRSLTEELVRNFLTDEFVIGPRAEDELATRLLPGITLDELNQTGAQFGGAKNRVVLISGPDGAKLPSEERVRAIVAEVETSKLEPWKDEEAPPLMPVLPAPGKIVAEKTLPMPLGLTEWTLGNGVRVVVKPSDFEADSVVIEGFATGGTSNISDKDFNDARFAVAAVTGGGLGGLDAVALGKALAGKNAAASVSLGELEQRASGSGSANDLETILQLIHLRMTAPRKDPAAFSIWKSNSEEELADHERSPELQFARKSTEVLYQGNPRRLLPAPANIAAVELDPALRLYRDRFGDASGFTFLIVGSVELTKLRPLVERYLASLPASGRKEEERDLKIRKVPGVVEKVWRLGEAPKAQVTLEFHGERAWSRDEERDVYILGRVLGIRLREVLRSGLGGVYGVSAGGSIARSPHQERSFTIRFGCDPNKVEQLIAATRAELAQLEEKGASDALLGKVKETYLRERETQLRENRYWSARLANLYRYGDDPALILDSQSTVARMTSAHVAAAAKVYLDDKEVYRAVMLPAQESKSAAPAK